MKHVTVIQHTQSEWLGMLEDHLEGRGIRFGYVRPFAAGAKLPNVDVVGDGVIILGGGPWGSVSDPVLPTLEEEVRLARACLMLEKPVLGFDLGAQILAIAADGRSLAAPLDCKVFSASRTKADALHGFMPADMPIVRYGRDLPRPPEYADCLATDDDGRAAVFQIGANAFGFMGNPGIKLAMVEDLVMEFEESPDDIAAELPKIRQAKPAIDDALVPLMTGLMQATKWMEG